MMSKPTSKPLDGAVLLRVSLMNLKGEASSDDMWRQLAEELPGIARCQKRVPLGEPQAHETGDLMVLLTTTASAVTIAGAVWRVYKSLIAPLRKRRGHESARMLTEVRNAGNAFRLQTFGQDAEKRVSVEQFVENIEAVSREDPMGFREFAVRLTRSGHVVQVGEAPRQATQEGDEDG